MAQRLTGVWNWSPFLIRQGLRAKCLLLIDMFVGQRFHFLVESFGFESFPVTAFCPDHPQRPRNCHRMLLPHVLHMFPAVVGLWPVSGKISRSSRCKACCLVFVQYNFSVKTIQHCVRGEQPKAAAKILSLMHVRHNLPAHCFGSAMRFLATWLGHLLTVLHVSSIRVSIFLKKNVSPYRTNPCTHTSIQKKTGCACSPLVLFSGEIGVQNVFFYFFPYKSLVKRFSFPPPKNLCEMCETATV